MTLLLSKSLSSSFLTNMARPKPTKPMSAALSRPGTALPRPSRAVTMGSVTALMCSRSRKATSTKAMAM